MTLHVIVKANNHDCVFSLFAVCCLFFALAPPTPCDLPFVLTLELFAIEVRGFAELSKVAIVPDRLLPRLDAKVNVE